MTAVAPAVVHESARTRVTRLTLGGRTVIRKQPLGTDAALPISQGAADTA
jgi:hypothetical protein